MITQDQADDMEAARHAAVPTLRATVPALEEMLFHVFPVLDHGFVRVVDYMGDDDAVVQAARVSYGRGTKRTSEDRGLIRYLMRHWHSTPFEMCEIKLHVKLPIFVARQWIRHRTANVNEYSARYSIMDREFYVPDAAQLAGQSAANRQGRDAALPADQAEEVQRLLRADADRAYDRYQWLLNAGGGEGETPADPEREGLSRELARIGLGLGTYTQWYWKVDLHNLLRFLRLRADPHAQYEIRVYAELMLDLVRRWVPLTHEAFVEYQMEAVTLSATALRAVKRMVRGEAVDQAASGLPAREWGELIRALDLPG